jgi:folate-binding protein YgfZ
MVSASAYRAAHEHAVSIDRSDRACLAVSGADRASYLQGLLTNDIVALAPGQGCYAAYLTPQGRMIADMLVYELGDALLLAVPREQKDIVLSKLVQLVFSEDVRLGDASGTFEIVAIVGPASGRILGGIVGQSPSALEELPEHANRRVPFADSIAVVTRITDAGIPGYDVYVERAHIERLHQALTAADVPQADVETAETIRIEAGIPRFNRDMDEDTIPLEAGIESRAISFTKGCYVGQEVIVRVVHRGHGRVVRKLVGLTCDGGVSPARGATVTAADRTIGTVTSSAFSPALRRPIALAYLHRDFLAAGTAVSVDGVRGVVSALPFVGGTV